MVKHFMIELVPKKLQVKYDSMDTLKDDIRIAEKKKANLKSTFIVSPEDTTCIHYIPLQASFLTSTFHTSNTASEMKAVMKQLLLQTTQYNLHLLQPQTFAIKNEIRTRCKC